MLVTQVCQANENVATVLLWGLYDCLYELLPSGITFKNYRRIHPSSNWDVTKTSSKIHSRYYSAAMEFCITIGYSEKPFWHAERHAKIPHSHLR